MIITHNNLTGLPSDIVLGKKAKYLLDLYKMSKGVVFNIPPFALLSSGLSLAYHKDHPLNPQNIPEDYINPFQGSSRLKDFYKGFVTQYYDTLKKAYDLTKNSGNPLIRLSICLDEEHNDSFAGVNQTIKSRALTAETFLYEAVPSALAGLYKPYTNWYLKRRGLEQANRSCSIMFSSFIHNPNLGIAHINGTSAEIYLGRQDETLADHFTLDLNHALKTNDPFYKLYRSLIFIQNQLRTKHIEVEFILKNKDPDDLFIQQIRPVKNNHPLTFDINNRDQFNHKHIYNAIDLPNNHDSLTRLMNSIVNPQNAVFFINHEDISSISHLDATSLILAFSNKYPNMPLHIVGVHQGKKPSTHMMTALREDPLYTFNITHKETALQFLSEHHHNICAPYAVQRTRC